MENSATARTSLESLLRRDRWLVGGALLVAIALCWAWIVPMARDMYGEMTGASAWMMTNDWDAMHLALLFAMWVVMMAGMMLPSAVPALFEYTSTIRAGPDSGLAPARAYAFAGGYVFIWTAFSLVATVLQRLFAHLEWLSPMMEPSNRMFGSALLIVAGIFQFTPLKRTCLARCRSAAQCSTEDIRSGALGGFRLGVVHGVYCLGCCWALMMLLFVGGVMNLWCIVALTVFVLLEKLAPFGAQSVRISGGLMIATGIWYFFR